MIDCDRQKQFIKTLKYRYMIATGFNNSGHVLSYQSSFNRIKVKCKCYIISLIVFLSSVLIESK